MKLNHLFSSLLICTFLTLVLVSDVSAYPNGQSGHTLKGPSPGCTCHTSSTTSSVSLVINGPSQLNAGATGNYSVLMTYTSTISKGGMNIAASNGTLAKVDARLKVLNGELCQPSAQTGTTTLTWSFTYQAPSTPGPQTLYATGCATKNRWNHANNFTVNIVSATPTITLLTPVIGNSFLPGSTQNITWSNSGVTNAKIESSADNGTTWNTVIASTPASAGTYAWTVPNTPSTQCQVKISDASNPAVFSVSGTFIISALPTLTIYTPLTGVNLSVGSITNITWSSSGVTNTKIENSTDNGTTWNTVIASTPASAGTYAWTVPNTPSTQCQVKISDASNPALSSLSGIFTISSPLPVIVSISEIRQNDANGVSLDTGLVKTIIGTISVANEFNSPSYIQDTTGGMAVYGRGATAFSGLVQIGDVVQVTGKVKNYNGLTEFDPVLNFTKLDSGQTVTPLILTISQINNQNWNGFEQYEGTLIKINSVQLVTPATNWSGNTNYQMIAGSDTALIRVTTGTTLVGQPAPSGLFDIVGVLSQYKVGAPHNSGYQVMPRFISDVSPLTVIKNEESQPAGYALEQNYPNPFNPSTMIRFSLPSENYVRILVYNTLGQIIQELASDMMSPGTHEIDFNATNLTSGTYFYTVQATSPDGKETYTNSRKMILMK